MDRDLWPPERLQAGMPEGTGTPISAPAARLFRVSEASSSTPRVDSDDPRDILEREPVVFRHEEVRRRPPDMLSIG